MLSHTTFSDGKRRTERVCFRLCTTSYTMGRRGLTEPALGDHRRWPVADRAPRHERDGRTCRLGPAGPVPAAKQSDQQIPSILGLPGRSARLGKWLGPRVRETALGQLGSCRSWLWWDGLSIDSGKLTRGVPPNTQSARSGS